MNGPSTHGIYSTGSEISYSALLCQPNELNEHQGTWQEERRGESLAAGSLGECGKQEWYAVVLFPTDGV